MFDKTILPDVADQQSSLVSLPLNWVGMEAIALPVSIRNADGSKASVTTKVDCFVNLSEAGTKGIHMSRLYLLLQERLADQLIEPDSIKSLLETMISSQRGLSEQAKVKLNFDLPIEKPALLSREKGYQSYEVSIIATLQKSMEVSFELELTIPYSSTCPCSAALSQQMLATTVADTFPGNTINKDSLLAWLQSEQGSVATPHSQRSYAYIHLVFEPEFLPNIADLILQLEATMGTPVQTAVKREDEQAFAKLNAENLMFCEDAARKLKAALETMQSLADYRYKIEHQESLHAHNAVVIDGKQ